MEGIKQCQKKINGKGITSHIENNECLFSAHLPGKSSKDHGMGHERVSIQQTLGFVKTHHGNPKHQLIVMTVKQIKKESKGPIGPRLFF